MATNITIDEIDEILKSYKKKMNDIYILLVQSGELSNELYDYLESYFNSDNVYVIEKRKKFAFT